MYTHTILPTWVAGYTSPNTLQQYKKLTLSRTYLNTCPCSPGRCTYALCVLSMAGNGCQLLYSIHMAIVFAVARWGGDPAGFSSLTQGVLAVMSLTPKEDPYKRRPYRSTATVSGAPGADASAGRADLMKAAPTQVLQHGNAGCGGAGGGRLQQGTISTARQGMQALLNQPSLCLW